MDRSIEATPVITGKAAKKLLKEIDAPFVLSPEKQEECRKQLNDTAKRLGWDCEI